MARVLLMLLQMMIRLPQKMVVQSLMLTLEVQLSLSMMQYQRRG
jgi:hypothetical protein